MKSYILISISLVLWSILLNDSRALGLTINKNTVEMLNTGLKALVSIKRILSTIKSVNELSAQAFPGLTANRPKIKFVEKLFGKSFGGGGGGSVGGMGSGFSSGFSSTSSALTSSTASPQSKSLGFSSGKRNPSSIGMIKIGEKPPPGLFPETMPYSVNGGGGNNGGSSLSSSSSSSSSLSGLSSAFDQATSGSTTSGETFKFPEAIVSGDSSNESPGSTGNNGSGRDGRSLFLQSLGLLGVNRHFEQNPGAIVGPFLANLQGNSEESSGSNSNIGSNSEELHFPFASDSHHYRHHSNSNLDSYENYGQLNFD